MTDRSAAQVHDVKLHRFPVQLELLAPEDVAVLLCAPLPLAVLLPGRGLDHHPGHCSRYMVIPIPTV